MDEAVGLLEAIYTTRAIRRFKPDPLPDELITALLEAATRAPNGGNAQRWRFIIIRGGSNINPYEVESMLRAHPAVQDACVVGRPHTDLGEVPVAFIVGQAGKEELDTFLEEQGLAHYKWPEAVYSVDELPLSGPGKVNRKSLREMAGARAV